MLTLAGPSTCLGCGCTCDDIRVRVSGQRIIELQNACDLGRDWFLQGADPASGAKIEGKSTTVEAALDRAAQILVTAKAPILTGLKSLTIEAQRVAVALADELGAVIDSCDRADQARQQALARVGMITATLGEVKARADVVAFFDVDPIITHPRHLERYSVKPEGRFLTRQRKIIVTGMSNQTGASLFYPMKLEARLPVLSTLRALLRGARLDATRVAASTGLTLETLRDWASDLTNATYGALFFGSLYDSACIESLFLLVRDLNERTRFVAIGLGVPGNGTGAEAVLTWQAGYPSAVDFANGAPRSLVGDTSAGDRIARSESDAILTLGETRRQIPSDIPSIAIGPTAGSDRGSTVAIPSARPGIESVGTVARVDGVMLPLRPILTSHHFAEVNLLSLLLERVKGLKLKTVPQQSLAAETINS